MGAIYTFMLPDSGTGTFTPTPTLANWVLEVPTARQVRLIRLLHKGLAAGGGANVARLARDTVIGTGARTPIASDKERPKSAAAPGFSFITSVYGTTAPTVATSALLPIPYMGNGDGVSWEAAPGGGFILQGTDAAGASLECHQDAGADVAVSGGAWEED